jgi:hypothetical protein
MPLIPLARAASFVSLRGRSFPPPFASANTPPLTPLVPRAPSRHPATSRRLRHLEMCGTWEGCALEGGDDGPVSSLLPPQAAGGADAAAGDMLGAVAPVAGPWGLIGGAADHAGTGGEERGQGVHVAGAGAWHATPAIPAWLWQELSSVSSWQQLLCDGWEALQCPGGLDAAALPRDLARILGVAGAARVHKRSAATNKRVSSVVQLCVLLGLHRALHIGHAPDSLAPGVEQAALSGIRCGIRGCACVQLGGLETGTVPVLPQIFCRCGR